MLELFSFFANKIEFVCRLGGGSSPGFTSTPRQPWIEANLLNISQLDNTTIATPVAFIGRANSSSPSVTSFGFAISLAG